MTHSSYGRLAFALFLVGAIAVLLPGCGRSVGTVTGKVTYNGKALKGGNVSFQSTEGLQSYSTEIKEDGTYSATIQTGSYKVCVETASLKPPATGGGPKTGSSGGPPGAKGMTKTGPKDAKEGKGGPPPDAAVPEGYTPSGPAAAKTAENLKRYVQIPDKYGDPTKTDLTYTFKGGTDPFDIDLK
jgi:hypothetical protein